MAYPTHNQRRCAAQEEHGAPSEARANCVIRNCGEEEAEIIAGVHISGAAGAPVLGPCFGDIDAAQTPLATDADP